MFVTAFIQIGQLGLFGALVIFADQITDPLPSVIQYGILGILVALLMTGKFVVPRFVYDQEKTDRLFWQAEVTRLHNLNEDRTIPALASSSKATEDMIDLIKEEQVRRRLGHT